MIFTYLLVLWKTSLIIEGVICVIHGLRSVNKNWLIQLLGVWPCNLLNLDIRHKCIHENIRLKTQMRSCNILIWRKWWLLLYCYGLMNYSLLTFILDSTGMVAALTNESATSKSVYFAHCTSEMIFITHMLAEEPEKLAGPLLADTYVTLLKGRNAWYGQNLAKGELSLEMGDSIKGKGMIQVWILIICKLVNKQTQKISNYVESRLI